MEAEHRTHQDAPPDCFESVVVVENILESQAVVLELIFIRVEVKEVLLGRLIVSDILPPELMDFSHLLSVLLGPLVEVILVEVLLPSLPLAWERA